MKIFQYEQASLDHPERCEDAIIAQHTPGKAAILGVIDGMGGHQRYTADGALVSGRDAAQLVRQTLIEALGNLPAGIDASAGGEAEQHVRAALAQANQRVWSELNAAHLPINKCVGAVATVMLVCENGARVLAAQIGDARGYVFSEGELIQICSDEDNIEYMTKSGMLDQADAALIADIVNTYDGVNEPPVKGTVNIGGSPYDTFVAWRWFITGNNFLNIPPANIVMNALGIDSENPLPQISRMEITPADVLFLCTDGVYKNLTNAEMSAALTAAEDAAAAAGEAAFARSRRRDNGRATKDDISAVAVRF